MKVFHSLIGALGLFAALALASPVLALGSVDASISAPTETIVGCVHDLADPSALFVTASAECDQVILEVAGVCLGAAPEGAALATEPTALPSSTGACPHPPFRTPG